MNIAQRNFFRLLRTGVFGQSEQIEPLSAWKWRRLLAWARALHTVSLAHDGIEACQDQFFMRMPDDLASEWREATLQEEQHNAQATEAMCELMLTLGTLQMRPILMEPWPTSALYPHPLHRQAEAVSIYFPFETQGQKADEWGKASDENADDTHRHRLYYQWKGLSVEHRHRMQQLNSHFTNATLQKIIEQEWLDGGTNHVVINGQRIETVAPTLYLLMSLLSIVKTTIRSGIKLRQIIDVGILLRQQGHRVDFVKLQTWTEQLRIGRMAQLTGEVLVALLGFTHDEVPFMQPNAHIDADALANSMLPSDEKKGKTKFRYFSPGESLASAVASFTHTLGNVKE